MSYSSEQQNRLKALLESVEARKPHRNAAPTYLDSAALVEIMAVVEAKLSDKTDTQRDTFEDSIAILRYLADSYEAMNKVAYAVKMYDLLLLTEAEAIKRYDTDKSLLKDDLYSAVRARNYYGKDFCADLSETVMSILGAEVVTNVISEITKEYPRLKRDSAELTEQYLSVIDEIEEKIEGARKTDLCHEYWSLKKQFLAEHGIRWCSPFELNPNVLFD